MLCNSISCGDLCRYPLRVPANDVANYNRLINDFNKTIFVSKSEEFAHPEDNVEKYGSKGNPFQSQR